MDVLNRIGSYLNDRYVLEKALSIALILIIGFLLIGIARFVIIKIIQKKAKPQIRMITKKIINYTGFGILLIILFSELGLELSAILGAAGIFGIAIGIASQKSLGNIISGFFLVSEKSFEIGDVLKVGERVGVVQSVELLSVMLRTFDNMLIQIPNEEMISRDIVNITKYPIRRMDIALHISYKDDLKTALDVLEETARENSYCLDEPSPFVMIKEFGDSGICIQYGIWFDRSDYKNTKNSIIVDIVENFRNSGITIPYKHITIEYGQEKTEPPSEK